MMTPRTTSLPSRVSRSMQMAVSTPPARAAGVPWSSTGSLEVDAPELRGWTAQQQLHDLPVPHWTPRFCCVLCGSQEDDHHCVVTELVGFTVEPSEEENR